MEAFASRTQGVEVLRGFNRLISKEVSNRLNQIGRINVVSGISLFAGALLIGLVSCQSADKNSDKSKAGTPAGVGVTQPSSWAGSMKGLQSNLADLEPYLIETTRFELPANQEVIQKKIDELAANASQVNHNPTLKHRDPTVQFVASQFSTHLKRASNHFRDGRKSFARYEIIKVTQFCVECHMRMQSGPEFTLGRIENFQTQMPLLDRAEYLIASRKFDGAFDLMIEKLRNARASDPEPWRLDRVAKMALQVAVQFKQDPAMADKVVKTVQENPGLPFFLKEKAKEWKKSVGAWKREKAKPKGIVEIQNLIYQRTSDVEAMRALPEILKKLSVGTEGAEASEWMFLAAESYRAINEISSIELSENYLEACIKNSPRSEIARKCFRALEGAVREGYTGSAGTFLPADATQELEELRKLAE